VEWTPEQNGQTLNLTNQFRLVSTSKIREALFQYSSDDSFVSYVVSVNFRFTVTCYTVQISEYLAVRHRCCSGKYYRPFQSNCFSILIENIFVFMKNNSFSEMNYRSKNPGKYVSFSYIQSTTPRTRTKPLQYYAV